MTVKEKEEDLSQAVDQRLKMSFSSAREWRTIVEALKVLEEANIYASPKGLECRAMEPSRVAMVDFLLPRSAFESYSCQETYRLGVHFGELLEIMKRSTKKDSLQMELKKGTLELCFLGDYTRDFSITLLDLGEKEYPPPEVSFKGVVKLLTGVIKRAVKDAEIVGDHLTFGMGQDVLTLWCSSETKETRTSVLPEDLPVRDFDCYPGERPTGTYSLDFIKEMTGWAADDSITIVHLADSQPLKLVLPLPAGGQVSYYIAPRIL